MHVTDIEPCEPRNVLYYSFQFDSGLNFEKKGILYWQGVKAWSPMYELLKELDESENGVLSNIHNKQFYIAETDKNSPLYYYHSSLVKEIWTVNKILKLDLTYQNLHLTN